eukprot:11290419-Heterocapsa_arctica.AAC.1
MVRRPFGRKLHQKHRVKNTHLKTVPKILENQHSGTVRKRFENGSKSVRKRFDNGSKTVRNGKY